jgi:hypothetical protein
MNEDSTQDHSASASNDAVPSTEAAEGVDRSTTAAAGLAALGYADEANMAQVNPILAEPNTASCLNLSKLNLNQCLAVA